MIKNFKNKILAIKVVYLFQLLSWPPSYYEKHAWWYRWVFFFERTIFIRNRAKWKDWITFYQVLYAILEKWVMWPSKAKAMFWMFCFLNRALWKYFFKGQDHTRLFSSAELPPYNRQRKFWPKHIKNQVLFYFELLLFPQSCVTLHFFFLSYYLKCHCLTVVYMFKTSQFVFQKWFYLIEAKIIYLVVEWYRYVIQ